MVHTRSFTLFLSAGMVLGVALLVGCAGQAQTRAPEPPGTVQGEVVDLPALLAGADQAFQDEAYEEARKLYVLAQQNAEGLTEEQADTVNTRIARIDSILHERALAMKAEQEAEQAASAAEPVASPEESARIAAEQVPALLDEAEDLLARQDYGQAAAKLNAIDPVRELLAADLKVRYDRVRFAVAANTDEVPALTKDEAQDRAQEDFDAGIDAYKHGDLLTARHYLETARQFGVGIGWLDNRKLRRTLSAIDKRLAELNAAFAAGKAAYEAEDFEAALEQLAMVAQSGVSLGAETDQATATMLADAREKVEAAQAAEKAAAEAQKEAAAAAEAQEEAAAAEVEEAPAVAEVEQEAPPAAEAKEEAPAVAEAEEEAPAAAQAEQAEARAAAEKERAEAERAAREAQAQKEAAARASFEAGMAAYEAGDYLKARQELRAARESGVGFGLFGNRKLRNALAEVEEMLARLTTAYQGGKKAYEAGDYETAQRRLSAVAQSGISLGEDVDAEVQGLLRDLEQKVAEQRAARAEQEAAQARAAAEEAARRAKELEERAVKLAAEAEALLQTQNTILEKLAQADQATARGDLQAAQELLNAAQELLSQPEVAQLHGLAGVPEQINAKLAAVNEAIAERKRIEAARAELAALVEEAGKLVETDVAAAEQKALAARNLARQNGLALSDQQQMVLAGVKQAVDEKFGVQRSIQRQAYDALRQLAALHADSGQYDKAAELLAILANAPATIVDNSVKEQAAADAAAMRKTAKEQKQKAQELAARFDAARQALREQGLNAALAVRASIVRDSKEAGISDDSALAVLHEADRAFLAKDVKPALEAARRTLEQRSDKMLAEARRAAAAAQPAQAAGEPPDLSEQVEQLYKLAQKLHQAVLEGKTARAADLKREMADVRLAMEVSRARHALQNGDYEQAMEILKAAPAADASEKARKSTYEPLLNRVQAILNAGQQLDATEEALAAHDFVKAVQDIRQVQADVLPKPLQVRLSALSQVLDAVRQAQLTLDRLSVNNEQAIAALEQSLAQHADRQKAWTAYTGALNALFNQSAEEAAKALADAAAMPGLLPAEAQSAAALAAGFGAGQSQAVANAEQMLSTAEKLFMSGDYAAAAQAVSNVKASKAYETSPQLQQRANELDKKIQAKEQEAEALYAQAVAAYEAGNAEEVGRLMTELKSDYSRTRVFQSHQ